VRSVPIIIGVETRSGQLFTTTFSTGRMGRYPLPESVGLQADGIVRGGDDRVRDEHVDEETMSMPSEFTPVPNRIQMNARSRPVQSWRRTFQRGASGW